MIECSIGYLNQSLAFSLSPMTPIAALAFLSMTSASKKILLVSFQIFISKVYPGNTKPVSLIFADLTWVSS